MVVADEWLDEIARTLRLQATSTMNTLFHSTLIAIERVRVRVRIVCCVFVEGER